MKPIPPAINLSPLRKIIASRMAEASASIPHFRVGADIEIDELSRLRRLHNGRQSEERASFNDCLIKACALVLRRLPRMNALFTDDKLHLCDAINISFMVSVKGGVTAPVIRGADMMPLTEISRAAKDLALRARGRGLRIADLAAGTFSISNLGNSIVDQFDAIINPPQSAILAVARSRVAPIATSERAIRFAEVCRMTLSLDHRVLDGSDGAEFLEALSRVIQNPSDIFAS